MNSKIIQDILDNIKDSSKPEGKYAIIKKYKPIPFSVENFHKISNNENNNKIAYVDGGNSEIIKSSELSLQIIRVIGLIKQKGKTIQTLKTSFYTLTQSETVNDEINKEGKIFFKTKIFHLEGEELVNEKDLLIDSMDSSVKNGVNRASISFVGGLARKFAEWSICSKLMEELGEGDIVLRDGNLDVDFVNEKNYSEKAMDLAKNKGIILSGLAKTSKVFCDNGNNVGVELDKFGVSDKWYYYPLAENCGTIFAKLNSNSKYVFRIDFLCREEQIKDLVEILALNSKDISFPGYPYGLIEADKLARVSDKEKEFLKTLLMSKAGKEFKEIEKLMTTENAHDILDSM